MTYILIHIKYVHYLRIIVVEIYSIHLLQSYKKNIESDPIINTKQVEINPILFSQISISQIHHFKMFSKRKCSFEIRFDQAFN